MKISKRFRPYFWFLCSQFFFLLLEENQPKVKNEGSSRLKITFDKMTFSCVLKIIIREHRKECSDKRKKKMKKHQGNEHFHLLAY